MIKLLLNCGIPETRGGVFTCVKTTLKYLDNNRYNISLTYYSDKKLIDYEKALYEANHNVTIYRLPSFSLNNLMKGKFFRAIKQFFGTHTFDILHSHDTFASAYYFKQAKKNNVKIRIMHSHNSKYSNTLPKSLRNQFLYQITKNAVTHGISCSHLADDFLFQDTPSTVIYNGINCKKFEFNSQYRKEIRQQYGIADDTIVMGNVAAFIPVKNQIFLINIMKTLKGKNYKLFLIGSGIDFEAIRQEVIANQLEESVLLLGQREDIDKLLSAMDMFLFPSLFEGFGISLLEAQVNGLISLASDFVPKEVQVTDLVSFLPIDKVNAKDLWLKQILSYKKVDNRENYRELVENLGFSSEKFVENLDKEYTKLLAQVA